MPYELITQRAMEGPQTLFCYANDITGGLFMPFVVFVLFGTLALSMYFAQVRMRQRGDAAVCFAVSAYAMIPFSVFIGMIPCMINGKVIVEIAILAAVGTLWLFFSKNSTESYG